MHPKRNTRRLVAGGLVLAAGLLSSAAPGQPPAGQPPGPGVKIETPAVDVDKSGALIVPLGGVVEFDPKTKVMPSEALVSNDTVLRARLNPASGLKTFLLYGLNPGLSQLTLRFQDPNTGKILAPDLVFDVVVRPDFRLLQKLIRDAVPTSNVTVTPGVGNIAILSGYVTSPQDAAIIEKLTIAQVGGTPQSVINAMQVGGVQQVQIDVVVASVDRNEVRSRGFDFFVNGKTFQFGSILSGLIGPQSLGTAVTTPIIPSANANLQFAVVPAQFFGALRALRTEGLAKFLAEPRVVTQTGRPAQFLAGGRQAVLSSSSGINGPGVTFETVGITLEVLPVVYGNNQIWLEVSPSNRQVNQAFGITTVFGAVPGFTEQSIRCAIMLENGQTFAIGGLIQNSVQASTAKVPILGDLPLVGTAFSSVSYSEAESELVILVTPRLVAPMDCSQVPKRVPGRETRSPDDYELFLESILEAPRGQRKVWNGKCYNAAYKCDPTLAAYPCAGNVCTGPNLTGAACGPNGCGAQPAVPLITTGTWSPPPAPVAPVAPPAIPLAPVNGGTSSAAPVAPPAPVAPLPPPVQGSPVSAPAAETSEPPPLPAVPVVIPPVGPDAERN